VDVFFSSSGFNKFNKGERANPEFKRATSEVLYQVKEDEICDFFGVDDQGDARNTFQSWKFYRINPSEHT